MFFNRSSSATPAAVAPAPQPATPAIPVAPPPAAGASAPVILIVDDSTMIRTAVAKTLAGQNYEILQADDGVNGLAAWEKDAARITLVISDVFMPRMDGLTMARELRRRSRTLPVLLMSSKLDEDSRWVAEEAGFRFLPKPFRDPYLLELVARMIRLRGASV
jgi:DNA-binding response OmpR family regulator